MTWFIGLKTLWQAGRLAKYAEWLAVVVAIFLVGFAFGQSYATDKFVTAERVQAARDQAAQGAALINWGKTQAARVKKDDGQARVAATAVHETLTQRTNEATAARAKALAALKQQRERADALATRNAEMEQAMGLMQSGSPAADVCVLPDGTRGVLDEAAGSANGHRGADDRTGEADAAGGTAAATNAGTAAADRLTCDQLTRGYVELGKWGRDGWAAYEAWQRWNSKRFQD